MTKVEWTMTEKQKFKAWGESYHSGIKRADGSVCPECGWDMYESTDKLRLRLGAVIGFSLEQPALTRGFEERIGIIIMECPECFQKFWYHCTAGGYEVTQEICPQWPKDAD